jgi:N-acetylmuramic acid 6-phosphate (MurNAc-6-P) etherase
LRDIARIDDATAVELLQQSAGHLKPALVMALAKVNYSRAIKLLEQNGGHVRTAVGAHADSHNL